jgi:hypothetical protein
MRYVEAPNEYEGTAPSLFLAGGISGVADWQRAIVRMLDGTDLVILNPRRRRFPIDDSSAAEAQIAWEFRYLRRAAVRLFWFPPQTLCPIALYELGAWSVRPGPLFVGTDPAYARRADVEVQTRLARPDVRVANSLDALADQVVTWARDHQHAVVADLACGHAGYRA